MNLEQLKSDFQIMDDFAIMDKYSEEDLIQAISEITGERVSSDIGVLIRSLRVIFHNQG